MKKRKAERRAAMAAENGFKAEVKTSDDLSQEQVEKIRQRAYELYEARGRENSHEIDDWLQAEAEVRITKNAHN
jgi:F0F1-type ATP synthase delta subunit